jgi:hypothetical protein
MIDLALVRDFVSASQSSLGRASVLTSFFTAQALDQVLPAVWLGESVSESTPTLTSTHSLLDADEDIVPNLASPSFAAI